MSRLWIIAYDIVDNRRRRAVAALLGAQADRIQESLFEGWLSPPEACLLANGITRLIDAGYDKVRLYPVGEGVLTRRTLMGRMPVMRPNASHWVF